MTVYSIWVLYKFIQTNNVYFSDRKCPSTINVTNGVQYVDTFTYNFLNPCNTRWTLDYRKRCYESIIIITLNFLDTPNLFPDNLFLVYVRTLVPPPIGSGYILTTWGILYHSRGNLPLHSHKLLFRLSCVTSPSKGTRDRTRLESPLRVVTSSYKSLLTPYTVRSL